MEQQRPLSRDRSAACRPQAARARAMHRGTRALRLPVAALLLLVALLPGGLARPQAAPGAAVGPTVTLDPTSGLPGSTVSISGTYFASSTANLQAGIGFEVDGQQVAVGQQTIVACPTFRVLTYGFGALCTGIAVTFQVPDAASPGQHTVTVSGSFLTFVGRFSYTGAFTVLQPSTYTATETPTETSTQTDVPTATPSETDIATETATRTPRPTGTATSSPSGTVQPRPRPPPPRRPPRAPRPPRHPTGPAR